MTRILKLWRWLSRLEIKQIALLFLSLSTLFFAPIFLGYAFLPAGYLFLNSLWYQPDASPGNVDLFDAIIAYYPLDEFLRSQLLQGVFPFWSPHNLAGHPVAFNGQSGFFYPIKCLLLLLFPSWLAHGLSLWLHTALAGFSSFMLARQLSLHPKACLFFGLAWMFNGFTSVWLELGFIAHCAAWTPLVALAALKSLNSSRYLPHLAGSVALLCLSAHLQFVLYFLFFAGCVVLISTSAWSWKRLSRLLLGGVLGLCLAAPCLIPSAILMSASQRPQMTRAFLMDTYRQFLASCPGSAILPDLYGNPSSLFCIQRISGAGNFIYSETCLYAGVITLWFALISLGDRQGRKYLVAALTALVLPATPLYLALAWLPGLSHLSSVRFVGLVHLFLLMAAAYGINFWLKHPTARWVKTAWFGLLALAAVAYSTLCIHLYQGWQSFTRPGVMRIPTGDLGFSEDKIRALIHRGFDDCYGLGNPNVFMPSLALMVVTWVAFSRRPHRHYALLALVTLVELTAFSYRYNPIQPHALVYPTPPEVSFLKQATRLGRVAGLGTIKPNTLQPFGLYDAGGYDSFYPRASGLYFSHLLGRGGRATQLPAQVFIGEQPSDPLLNLLGVEYLIGRPGGIVPQGELVAGVNLPIYHRSLAHPRAFFCGQAVVVQDAEAAFKMLQSPDFQPTRQAILYAPLTSELRGDENASVTIENYTPNQVKLRVKTSQPQLLVLTDGWCEGWTAWLEGREEKIHQVHHMFRGVVVGAGQHELVFRFIPPFWTLSCVLFWGAILVLMGLSAFPRDRQTQSEKSATDRPSDSTRPRDR